MMVPARDRLDTVFEWVGVYVTGGYDAFEKEYALGLKLVWAKVAGKVFADKNGVGKFGGQIVGELRAEYLAAFF